MTNPTLTAIEYYKITGRGLHHLWATNQPVVVGDNAYSVHKMSYGDYFLEPWGTNRGETQGFARGTLWMEKCSNDPKVAGIYQVAGLNRNPEEPIIKGFRMADKLYGQLIAKIKTRGIYEDAGMTEARKLASYLTEIGLSYTDHNTVARYMRDKIEAIDMNKRNPEGRHFTMYYKNQRGFDETPDSFQGTFAEAQDYAIQQARKDKRLLVKITEWTPNSRGVLTKEKVAALYRATPFFTTRRNPGPPLHKVDISKSDFRYHLTRKEGNDFADIPLGGQKLPADTGTIQAKMIWYGKQWWGKNADPEFVYPRDWLIPIYLRNNLTGETITLY
jgi:hypothetical protein